MKPYGLIGPEDWAMQDGERPPRRDRRRAKRRARRRGRAEVAAQVADVERLAVRIPARYWGSAVLAAMAPGEPAGV